MSTVLIHGKDLPMVSQCVSDAVDKYLGGESRDISVSSFAEKDYLIETEESSGDYKSLRNLVESAQTAPLLASKRVIVGRELGYLGSKSDTWAQLITYLENPLPDTYLVLVWEKSSSMRALPAMPKKLVDAVEKFGGEIVDVDAIWKQKTSRIGWLEDQLSKHKIILDAGAKDAVLRWLGDNPSGLSGLLQTLGSTHGHHHKISREQAQAYLTTNESGSVPFWDLTDAIDSGNRSEALRVLRRILEQGDMEPIKCMFLLHKHFEQFMKLDGSNAETETQISQTAGLPYNQTFRASRMLAQTKRLGHARICRIFDMLHHADLDLRGKSGLEPIIVLEILVARLASQLRWRE